MTLDYVRSTNQERKNITKKDDIRRSSTAKTKVNDTQATHMLPEQNADRDKTSTSNFQVTTNQNTKLPTTPARSKQTDLKKKNTQASF
jgi:hypothetical protein